MTDMRFKLLLSFALTVFLAVGSLIITLSGSPDMAMSEGFRLALVASLAANVVHLQNGG